MFLIHNISTPSPRHVIQNGAWYHLAWYESGEFRFLMVVSSVLTWSSTFRLSEVCFYYFCSRPKVTDLSIVKSHLNILMDFNIILIALVEWQNDLHNCLIGHKPFTNVDITIGVSSLCIFSRMAGTTMVAYVVSVKVVCY